MNQWLGTQLNVMTLADLTSPSLDEDINIEDYKGHA